MQYDENAEKYGYEGEMTPLKCDELKPYTYDDMIDGDADINIEYYPKSDADEAIAELKEFAENACLERDDNQTSIDELQAENAELKKKLMPCLNGDCILTCEVIEKYGKENAELKQKLEDVQASMYADVVDANMENRRLRRALWLARADRASDKARIFYFAETFNHKLNIDGFSEQAKGRTSMHTARWWNITFLKVERKCRAKMEEYK